VRAASQHLEPSAVGRQCERGSTARVGAYSRGLRVQTQQGHTDTTSTPAIAGGSARIRTKRRVLAPARILWPGQRARTSRERGVRRVVQTPAAPLLESCVPASTDVSAHALAAKCGARARPLQGGGRAGQTYCWKSEAMKRRSEPGREEDRRRRAGGGRLTL
jgi:hypothetical protein